MDKKSLTKFLLASAVVISSPFAYAAEEPATTDTDSEELSLEELMNTQVYSASKRPEKLSDTASSVYIITSEDIKRAGATSIPEALRMAPGVNVAQTNANTWAISIRGFNAQYSNKLLVLIDGRSVYTPLFSGVYWDSQDYVLEDIDRIEVIKGPGGTVWGANAVNGVINIITKEARKTQGNYASFTGNNKAGYGEYRYGGHIGEYDYYRVYGKYKNIGEFENVTTHNDNNDDWSSGQSGFRYDFRDKDYNQVTLQGDVFDNQKDISLTVPTAGFPFSQNLGVGESFQGGNVMLKWNITNGEYITDIKAYTDYTRRVGSDILNQKIATQDLEIQTQRNYGINSFIGGAEVRYITDSLTNSIYAGYSSPESSVMILSTFLQDKISLIADKLFLTLGSKFDYNDYTNFEVEPNARISYQINDHHSVWAAVSQAVRTPTRGEDGFSALIPSGPPYGVVTITGNQSYESENLTAYELGYRGDITDHAFLDVSAFYNVYDNLRTSEIIAVNAGPSYVFSSFNNGKAETYGLEAYSIIGLTDRWDIKPAYTLLEQNFHVPPGNTDTLLEQDQERSPEHQFSIGSYVKVADDVNWDTNFYYISNLHYYQNDLSTGFVAARRQIDSYGRLDTQVRWNVMKDVELSLIGQNLLDDKHEEFNEILYSSPSLISRTFMARVAVKF